MNFTCALQQLKNGNKVRRKVWKEFWGYLYILKDSGAIMYLDKNSLPITYTLRVKSLDATDWELVGEEFNLSDKIITKDNLDLYDIFRFDSERGAYKEEDVKEFIKKIKEELNPAKNSVLSKQDWIWVMLQIDKLAGDKLI
jgi:hypothetical protein